MHWRCSRCPEATSLPPGDHVFLTNPPVPDAPPPEPDWIVVRQGPDLPHTLMPPELDGLWVDRSRLADAPERPGAIARTVPTGRFEVRTFGDDVEVAEVYELQPVEPEPGGAER